MAEAAKETRVEIAKRNAEKAVRNAQIAELRAAVTIAKAERDAAEKLILHGECNGAFFKQALEKYQATVIDFAMAAHPDVMQVSGPAPTI